MKKNLAAYRYLDDKTLSLYASETHTDTIRSVQIRGSAIAQGVKRGLDVLFSLFVLLFGFPFYMTIALFIKLTSQGPVLFVQERVGRDGRPFRLYKFRTMMNNNSDSSHRDFAESFIKGGMAGDGKRQGVFKITEDPRVTSIGRFLRRTSLDELPQFWNVLRGEMSVVGPRPPLTYELDHYQEWHKERLAVKPGLTGFWQVNGRSMVPFDEMVGLDLYYIENWSLYLDAKIVLKTVPVMLRGSGGF